MKNPYLLQPDSSKALSRFISLPPADKNCGYWKSSLRLRQAIIYPEQHHLQAECFKCALSLLLDAVIPFMHIHMRACTDPYFMFV